MLNGSIKVNLGDVIHNISVTMSGAHLIPNMNQSNMTQSKNSLQNISTNKSMAIHNTSSNTIQHATSINHSELPSSKVVANKWTNVANNPDTDHGNANNSIKNRVGGASQLRPLTPPYVRCRIRRFQYNF